MKRNGSALLIVLGVLSFLVVSAVAFSAYMRRARLPSSYLRRTVASRELAKAALARAVDDIDHAIADDVHPGIGNGQVRTWQEGRVTRKAKNTWRDRIFFKEDGESYIKDTTPTLTLEGLAYLPPALVNEVRYWSRRTPTAKWQSFGYDIGRFAYCAVDVSDYFDVNRLVADYPRSSAANRRITAAHIFEPVGHRSAPSDADAWDTFMEKFREIDDDTLEISFDSSSKMPLISLADFNLALGDKGSIGKMMKSPFAEFLKTGTGSFYPAEGMAQLETYAAMTFVTDGWFPRGKKILSGNGNNAIETYDLSDGRYQPYQMAYLQKGGPLVLSRTTSLYKTQVAPSTEAKTWYDRLSGLGMTALADYLDADHVPISLAVPTTERVPMICGVEPKFAGSPSFGVDRTEGELTGWNGGTLTPDDSQVTERNVELVVRWAVKSDGLAQAFLGGRIHTLVAYPFLHKDESDTSSWTLDGKFAMFLTSESPIPFRTKNASDALHLASATLPDSGLDVNTGVMTVKLGGGASSSPNFPAKMTDEESAVWEGDLELSAGVRLATDLANPGNELLKVTYQWTQTREQKPQGGFTDWTPSKAAVLDDPGGNGATIAAAHTAIPALSGGEGRTIGSRDADFEDNALKSKLNADPNWSKRVHLNAAVWLRIKDADDKIVDMVPASILDDSTQNSISDPTIGILLSGSHALDGSQWPILKFSTGISFDFGIAGLKNLESAANPITIAPSAVMVPDPRYNHAPENWYAESAGNITKSKWLETNLVGGNDRDGDIFMATSDAGYLQSIYELAFLPRFTNLETYGNSGNAGNYNIPQNNWNDNEYATDAGHVLNADFMWRTYDPIGKNKTAFENLPFTSEGTGMKVNPYSDSTNVLMAAFANTPVDWRHAHTNYEFSAALDAVADDVSAFNSKYAWNEYSEGGKFAWEDLQKVAGHFMWRMRNSGNQSWQTVWNNIDWYGLCSDGKVFSAGGGQDMQMTGDTDEMWDADRKFLYGFWRDCFDAKQQLFLIFIRAEPLLLGGGTADQLPPQLGARAVALVWRDPSTATGATGGYPHRTRLLFYRPLD